MRRNDATEMCDAELKITTAPKVGSSILSIGTNVSTAWRRPLFFLARLRRGVAGTRRTKKNPPEAGYSLVFQKGAQTTFRLGTLVIGLKAVVKKLLYISLIFWDSATKVS
jgi:hypothetical protein